MSHKEANKYIDKFLNFFTPDFNDLDLGLAPPEKDINVEDKDTEIIDHPQEFYTQQQETQKLTPTTLVDETQLDTDVVEDMSVDEYVDTQTQTYDGPINEWATPQHYISDEGFNPKVDSSIGAIAYLRSLGYNIAFWDVNESHDEWDICDELRSSTFSLDELIDYASVHKIVKGHAHPPACIWAQSHPDCQCHLVCYPPDTIDDIPDSAPGLPTYAEPELLNDFKFKLLQNLPVVIVTPYTQAPDFYFFHQGAILQLLERFKKAEQDNWIEDIQPITINKTTMIEIELGLQHPITQGDIGFQLQRTNTKSRVYSWNSKRIFEIPTKYLTILSLQESDSTDHPPGTFVNVDGNIGLIHRILNGNILCYLPEIDTQVTVDNVPISVYTY